MQALDLLLENTSVGYQDIIEGDAAVEVSRCVAEEVPFNDDLLAHRLGDDSELKVHVVVVNDGKFEVRTRPQRCQVFGPQESHSTRVLVTVCIASDLELQDRGRYPGQVDGWSAQGNIGIRAIVAEVRGPGGGGVIRS